jgi:hypothetical protein
MDATKKSIKGGGSHGLSGYEYQIDVSVWLALDLLLATRLASELTLEPLSQEDLEAEVGVGVGDLEPGCVTSVATLGNYQLVVQAKLRSGDAWTIAGIKALLLHEGKARPAAATRLVQSNVRYLLVTSAALNGEARRLNVRQAGTWPSAKAMPISLKKALPQGAAGRVAIASSQDDERLEVRIKSLLTESFRVPNARWQACRTALRDDARIRIRGGAAGRWARAEIESVLRMHDGYIASSPELEQYVYPTNWPSIRSKLAERHAILIVGQSGTGKTLATRKLYEELRKETAGLSRVPISLGPQQLRDDQTQKPVLFDIEDPWGRYDFDPNGRPWNDQLAQFFAHATHDRMMVATSRFDVIRVSGALEVVRPWLIHLEAEHYGELERARLYRSRIAALPRALQKLALDSEASVLAELSTPLEIQKFFDALPTLDAEELKNPPGYIKAAIRKAHQDSIERTVIDQIEARKDIRAAAVLWALLKAYDRLSMEVLREIEELLADKEKELESGVSPLIEFFIASRNLRQKDSTVVYYHPRVESGIQQALLRQPLIARRMFKMLVDVLVSKDGPGSSWGISGATRLVEACHRVPGLKLTPITSIQEKIDAWLALQLAKAGKELERNLALAAIAGSSQSPVSELARFLRHRGDRSLFDMMNWSAPEHDDAWYERLGACPAVRPLLEAFISEILPTERDDFGAQFVTAAERLAPDLSASFLKAASVAVHYGVLRSTDAVIAGALRDIDGFEPIVDTAAEVLTQTPEAAREAERIRLAITNDEYSDDYAEYLQNDDEGYTAQQFLSAYVDRVRETGNWRRLPTHRHLERLRFYWLRDVGADKKLDPEELQSAFDTSLGQSQENYLWHALCSHWSARFLPPLIDRIIQGHPKWDVRIAALSCLIRCAPNELVKIGKMLLSSGRRSRMIDIVLELVDFGYSTQPFEDEKPSSALVEPSIATLPNPYQEIAGAALSLRKKESPLLSEDTCSLLTTTAAETEEHHLFRIALDSHITLPVEDDVRWLLNNAEESGAAVRAIEAAIRHNMIEEIRASLSHRFSHVVAAALTAVAAPQTAPLPPDLLAMSKSKGSPVRKALVALLDGKPHLDHLPTLLDLAGDEWSVSLRSAGESEDYPIAQAAVEAIGKLAPLSTATGEHLYKLAIDTSDPWLRQRIFSLLARVFGSLMQDRLLALSVRPGQREISRLAAGALLVNYQHLESDLVARIAPEALLSSSDAAAVRLAAVVAVRGQPSRIRDLAQALVPDGNRRVLLLVIAAILRGRNRHAAESIAAMLPDKHPGALWAVRRGIGVLDERTLEDLGDARCVGEVVRFLKSFRGEESG